MIRGVIVIITTGPEGRTKAVAARRARKKEGGGERQAFCSC